MNPRHWFALAGGAVVALYLTRGRRHRPVEGARESLIAMPRDWDRETRRGPPPVCYRTKSAALRAFKDANLDVIERSGGLHFVHGEAEFDAMNERLDLMGKPRVRTLAQALWVAMPPGRPYCLDRVDVDLLNETTPGKEHPVGFRLPDHVIQADLFRREQEHYRDQAPSEDGSSDVPF